MSIIKINNLTFAHEGSYDNIFEDASFQIDTDWRLGFIGRNGRGKTTFLNLLLGKYEYKGTITASALFDYFPFEIPDKQQNTLNALSQFYPGFSLWELQREMSLLELDEEILYRPFDTLSKGEQTKIMLAALFIKENRFLLIDEPTNHLDIKARETAAKYLKSKKGFILVSHDRSFLDESVDHILSINKADIEIQKGNFSSWWENKSRRDQFELAENERLEKDIGHLQTAAKRSENWSDKIEKSKSGKITSTRSGPAAIDRGHIGHQAAKMMKRSKSIENRRNKAAEEKTKLLKNIESSDNLKIFCVPHHAQTLVALENVCISYENRQICKNVNFTINQGDRIALTGRNGSGKSSILKLIMGGDIQYESILKKASNLKISYVPQDTSFLSGTLSEFAEKECLDESVFKTNLSKLDLSRIQFEKDISDFSEGQKKKVLLAKSLSEKAHLYIWDEPLNFIDIFSRVQLEELLLNYKPTIIFVEHDKAFSENIATKRVFL